MEITLGESAEEEEDEKMGKWRKKNQKPKAKWWCQPRVSVRAAFCSVSN